MGGGGGRRLEGDGVGGGRSGGSSRKLNQEDYVSYKYHIGTESYCPCSLCYGIGTTPPSYEHTTGTRRPVKKKKEKLEDDIITPNEYTLDLITSPLFYVDILYLQISSNNVSAGRCQHKNYHMIQITSLGNSMWGGEVW